MSKGYMIFVEGQNEPKCVYANYADAKKDAWGLAVQNRDKAVTLLQIHKRCIVKAKKGEAVEKLPTHIPLNINKPRLGLNDLVFKEALIN